MKPINNKNLYIGLLVESSVCTESDKMYAFFLALLLTSLPGFTQSINTDNDPGSYNTFSQNQNEGSTVTGDNNIIEKVAISDMIEEVGKSYFDVYLNFDVYVVKVLIFESISPSLAKTIQRVLEKYELSRLYDYTADVRCLLLVHKKGMENDIDLFTIYSGDEQLLIINGRKSVVGEAISAILSYRATKT